MCRCLPSLLLCLAAAGVSGCRVTDLRLWGLPPLDDAVAVNRISDVTYCEGKAGQERRHYLDLFLPWGRKDYPVVLLVHGGAWMVGDNRCCGLYQSVGEFLASRGIGAVLCNYRLSPGVKHPEQIKDVARAFAWTRAHIVEYGGNPEQMFLVGHSAGGHLVALLATDESWLKAERLRTSDVKGVVAVSGVYHIPPEGEEYTLGGATAMAFHLKQMLPLRTANNPSGPDWFRPPGLPVKLDVYGPVFGIDPSVRADASPVKHVRPGLPPFLIFTAEHDLPSLPRMAEEFHAALLEQQCQSQLVRVEMRNHNSIMFKAIEEQDPVGGGIVAFIRQHTPATCERP
jgi:acetyl esterase/lipase